MILNLRGNDRPESQALNPELKEGLIGGALLSRAGISGGASRDRTGDLYNAIVALSQLSYSPVRKRSAHFTDLTGIGQASF